MASAQPTLSPTLHQPLCGYAFRCSLASCPPAAPPESNPSKLCVIHNAPCTKLIYVPRVAQCLVILCTVAFSGCTKNGTVVQAEALTGGDVAAGKKLIYSFACGSCHVIPGIANAVGTVGPPLQGFASRVYIAGSLVNTPDNLSRWIKHPPQIKPGSAMPDLGVSDEQVRHIAAYLYTLH